jgi:hypothetical protein
MTEAAGTPQVPAVQDNQKKYLHSHVFDELISSPEDLPGLVAYGFYKSRKRQWIIEFEQENGRAPTKDECLGYSFGFREQALLALRDEAEGTLFRFAEGVIDSRKPELVSEAFNQRVINELSSMKTSFAADISGLREQLKKVTGYRHHIVGHVIGFIVLLLLVFIFSVAIKYEPHLADFFNWQKHDAASSQ